MFLRVRPEGVAAMALASAGCDCPERTIWNNYLSIEVMGMPQDVVAARVIVDGRQSAPLACVAFFDTEGGGSGVEGDSGDFGEIVTTDCDAADSTGTYGQSWWTLFPHEGTGERIILTLDWETASGARGGFEDLEVLPEWTWTLGSPPQCGADIRGHVFIDPEGNAPVRY